MDFTIQSRKYSHSILLYSIQTRIFLKESRYYSVHRMYSLVFEWILQFVACLIYSHSILHNLSKQRESFRLKKSKGEVRFAKRMYFVVFEWISQFAACLHNPSKRRESFRKKAEVRYNSVYRMYSVIFRMDFTIHSVSS